MHEGSYDMLESHSEIGHVGSMDHAINQSAPGRVELLNASLAGVARGEPVPVGEGHHAIGFALA